MEKPNIPEKTMKEMGEFFMKTSIPRIMGNPNHTVEFQKLSQEDRDSLVGWIANNLYPIKSFNQKHTSYGLKHIYQRDTGLYVYNGAFKGAMLDCGFEVKDKNAINWVFNVSERSPAFKGANK